MALQQDFDFVGQVVSKTNSELIAICSNSKAYQKEYVVLAKEELDRRGIPVPQSVEDKTKGKTASDSLLSWGIFFAIAWGALLYLTRGNSILQVFRPEGDLFGKIANAAGENFAGIIAIWIGVRVAFLKKRTAAGKKIFVYNPKSRKKGIIVIVWAIVAAIIALSIKPLPVYILNRFP